MSCHGHTYRCDIFMNIDSEKANEHVGQHVEANSTKNEGSGRRNEVDEPIIATVT